MYGMITCGVSGFVWMGFYCKISFGAMYGSKYKCKIPTYCCSGPANASIKTLTVQSPFIKSDVLL